MVNKNKLLEVKLKYPELMSDKATERIKEIYFTLLEAEKELYQTRNKVYKLEAKVKELKDNLKDIEPITSLIFETKEIKQIKKECNILIDNPTDAARSYYKPN